MIPLIFKIRIERTKTKPFRLFIPLFLVWLIVFPLLIALSPLVLIAALIMKKRGYTRLIISVYPILFLSLSSLSGLTVEIENEDKKLALIII